MPRYQINFNVTQLYSGSITVDAETVEAAREAWDADEYEDERSAATLDLMESEDTIEEIIILPEFGTATIGDNTALLAIQTAMSGTEWNADTLETIAEIMRKAGYEIDETDEEN